MKTVFTLLLALITCAAYGHNKDTYQKLCEVNKCWTEQQDIQQLDMPAFDARGEREWIRTHLQLVEQVLRSRSTEGLSAAQTANRLTALSHLNEYWHDGNFPINDKYSYRTPIFIDRYDNFCAVGYLVKATGHEEVSRMIAANTNLAYVREMNYLELNEWAKEYGFTTDELAWIQPGYPPESYVKNIGGGTDGNVYELATSNSGSLLYVGGSFSNVDDNISTNNIAYLKEENGSLTWHAMGEGLNGRVNAVAEHNSNVFAGGTFSMSGSTAVNNVAYWDGTKWNAAGCIAGDVRDLCSFNNELYAAGDFDVCAAMSEVNFAKWNGTTWTAINMLEGQVNVIQPIGDGLILGGKFKYMNEQVNIIKYEPANGFVKYANTIENEVSDIKVYQSGIYAATTGDVDSTKLLLLLNSSTKQWETQIQLPFSGIEQPGINTLCVRGNDLLALGDLQFTSLIQPGPTARSSAILFQGKLTGYDGVYVDSAVNKAIMFKDHFIVAGNFNNGFTGGWGGNQPVHSIARWSSGVSIPTMQEVSRTISIYPNPAKETITITNNFGAKQLILYAVNGQEVAKFEVNAATVNIPVSSISVGTYIAEISDAQGNKATQKIVIE